MAQELELGDYATVHELQGNETRKAGTKQPGMTATERRLLRIGILTLGVLCIVQATLNISLRLAFYSKPDTAHQFPFDGSINADVCETDPSQENSTHSCTCYKNLLRTLREKYNTLEIDRNKLLVKINEIERDDSFPDAGSGIHEEFIPYGKS